MHNNKRILFRIFSCGFLVALLATGAAKAAEVDNNATPLVISEGANAAGLTFLLTPKGTDARIDATMEELKLVNAIDYANRDASSSQLYTGGVSQLAGNSGFTFDIAVAGVPSGYSAVVGFSSICSLTPVNMGGSEGIQALVAALADQPRMGDWVAPGEGVLKRAGLHVYVVDSDGTQRDITDIMSCGINVSNAAQDRLTIVYGAMLADRALTDKEGTPYSLSYEDGEVGQERLLSDGRADGRITTTWYVAYVGAVDNNATPLVINNEANGAMLGFLLTPRGTAPAIEKTMETLKLVNASDYANLSASRSGNYTGGRDQVAGSGFTFDIAVAGVPSGYSALVGFNKMFALTSENLGEQTFQYLRSAFAQVSPTGGWAVLEAETLNGLGLFVMSVASDGTVTNVTESATVAMNSAMAEGSLMVGYGAMMADRALTGEEGKAYPLSWENGEVNEEMLLSDGNPNERITGTWFMAHMSTNTEVITEEANRANLEFEIMPRGYYAQADQNMEDRKLYWVTEENVSPSMGDTHFISGNEGQLPGNSGFSMTLPVTGIPEGYSAALGFSSRYTFTQDNLGSETYQALASAVADMPKTMGWVMPSDGSPLTRQGIRVMARYPGGEERDVTDEMNYGLYASEDGIILSYGAIAVDRPLTANEGEALSIVVETLSLVSDGRANDTVTATWYITKASSSGGDGGSNDNGGSSGCDAGFASLALAVCAGLAVRKE